MNRPPRPDERKRCLDTPPFFFFEKAGGEIVVLSCNYLLDQKVTKKIKSCRMDHPPDSYRDFADIAIARLATPPFFFYKKVGGEILALFLFLTLLPYISLKLEKHENVFYPIPLSLNHLIPFCASPTGYPLPSGDAQCGWKCYGE